MPSHDHDADASSNAIWSNVSDLVTNSHQSRGFGTDDDGGNHYTLVVVTTQLEIMRLKMQRQVLQ